MLKFFTLLRERTKIRSCSHNNCALFLNWNASKLKIGLFVLFFGWIKKKSFIKISQMLKCRTRKQNKFYWMHCNEIVKISSLKHAEKTFLCFLEKSNDVAQMYDWNSICQYFTAKAETKYIDRIKFKYGLLNCGQYFQKL